MNTIISNNEISNGIYRMVINSPEIARKALPGQFVHVRCSEGFSTILRRPVSIHRAMRKEGTIELIYQVKGTGTKFMAKKRSGDEIDLLGPLGTGFDMNLRLKSIAVIGGGIGIFPLMFLAEESGAEIKRAYLGFKDKDSVILKNEFEAVSSVSIATEDGSEGYAGFVTDMFVKDLEVSAPDIIYACGPLPMLKKVAEIAEDYCIPCQVSMEQRMACGVGACLGCAVKIKDGDEWAYKHVCKNGPVFWSRDVIFS